MSFKGKFRQSGRPAADRRLIDELPQTMNPKPIGRRPEPAFIEPMQCKPVTALPAGEQWTFEIKFDGYRCVAIKCAREVTLFSRHKKVLNKRFPFVGRGACLPRW